jgi:hypothetical protein
MASKALHAAWRRSTSCGVGWICRDMNAPVLGLCAWTGVFLWVCGVQGLGQGFTVRKLSAGLV